MNREETEEERLLRDIKAWVVVCALCLVALVVMASVAGLFVAPWQ